MRICACILPKLGNDPAPKVGGAAAAAEIAEAGTAADGAVGVPNENVFVGAGARYVQQKRFSTKN